MALNLTTTEFDRDIGECWIFESTVVYVLAIGRSRWSINTYSLGLKWNAMMFAVDLNRLSQDNDRKFEDLWSGDNAKMEEESPEECT